MRSVAVVVGGAFGSLTRWGVGTALVTGPGGFPWGTFIVNLTGAFGLGLTWIVLSGKFGHDRNLPELVGIGFFGGFTTFSALSVEGIRLFDRGRPSIALAYWGATLLFGQVSALIGVHLGRRLLASEHAT